MAAGFIRILSEKGSIQKATELVQLQNDDASIAHDDGAGGYVAAAYLETYQHNICDASHEQ